MQAAEENPEMECSDGFTRKIVPLAAAWLGNREQHKVMAGIVNVESGFC